MYKVSRILVGLILFLALASQVTAQDIVTPQYTEATWQAAYWNNTTLSGSPVLWRSETALDYDWGAGSPDPRVNPDQFSGRWSRYVDLVGGLYRFTITSDDGVRLWVDGELVFNDWSDHAARTGYADKQVATGEHLLMVEFYENAGMAVLRVSWAPVSPPVQMWRGEYYNNTGLSGAPATVRDDAQIDFAWGEGSPVPGIVGADQFSVRWSRTIDLPAGLYRFAMTVDDGGRLWANGQLVIDAWFDGVPRTFFGDIWLPGGPVPIRMEYYENMGIAQAKLTWSGPGTPPAPGEVVVDDTDPGFVKGGSPTGWRTAQTGYGGSLTWTRNNDWKRPNYNWARWYPTLQPGYYEVFVFIPDLYTTTASAHYWVAHYHGFTQRIVDQSANGDRWVSLGTYYFGGAGEYVSLNDITYEPYVSRLMAFDAVKWVKR